MNRPGKLISAFVFAYAKSRFSHDEAQNVVQGLIMILHLCDLYPLSPYFYIVKLGFTGYAFFQIFAQKHKSRVLKPVPTICALSKNIYENSNLFQS